ncbi:MAG: hypothetical protein M3494_04280 [Actinomycetota bacterium]|nr:hypothetical protein [Actinomycetota bacterium]
MMRSLDEAGCIWSREVASLRSGRFAPGSRERRGAVAFTDKDHRRSRREKVGRGSVSTEGKEVENVPNSRTSRMDFV